MYMRGCIWARRASAFTLVEMVLALGILAILMVAGESAIEVAAHSLPNSNSPTYSTGSAQRALAQLASELRYANSVTVMTANSITFTVAPRGSDTSNETICYSWDGTPGDPLTRQYNSDAAVNVATNVNAFSLQYDKLSQKATTTYGASAPGLLYTNDTGTYSAYCKLQQGTAYDYASQSFTPTLPPTASSWQVTKVVFIASQDAYPGGQFSAQIRTSAGGLPSQNVIQQATVNGSALSGSVAWYSVTFPSPKSMAAGTESALTLQWISNAYKPPVLNLLGLIIVGGAYYPPADIYCRATSGSSVMADSSDGSTWSNVNGYLMPIYIYGTYTTPNPPAYNYFLQNIQASLQLGGDPNSAVQTGVAVLNQPQVSGP